MRGEAGFRCPFAMVQFRCGCFILLDIACALGRENQLVLTAEETLLLIILRHEYGEIS